MKPIEKVRRLLQDVNLDSAIITRRYNFAWLTGGGSSAIRQPTDDGVASLVVKQDETFLVTTNIEARRLMEEQIPDLPVEPLDYPWHSSPDVMLKKLLDGERVGSDNYRPATTDLSPHLSRLRSVLEPEEMQRYRSFANQASATIEAVCARIAPGWSEQEIYADMAHEAALRFIRPVVALVAADDRVFAYRHPLPTDRKLRRYAMLVISAERHGLIANATRFVHFGPLPDDLAGKHRKVAHIHSALIAGTRPGRPYHDFFQEVQGLYAQAGWPDEWRLHHQGGPTGYLPREFLVGPMTPGQMRLDQAFAWNPSLTGAKAEDTFLLTAHGPEILTLTSDWPTLDITVHDRTWPCPAVLIRTQ